MMSYLLSPYYLPSLALLGRTAEVSTVLAAMQTRFETAPRIFQYNERSSLDLARRALD